MLLSYLAGILMDLREAIKKMVTSAGWQFAGVHYIVFWVEPAGNRLSRLAVLSRLAFGFGG